MSGVNVNANDPNIRQLVTILGHAIAEGQHHNPAPAAVAGAGAQVANQEIPQPTGQYNLENQPVSGLPIPRPLDHRSLTAQTLAALTRESAMVDIYSSQTTTSARTEGIKLFSSVGRINNFYRVTSNNVTAKIAIYSMMLHSDFETTSWTACDTLAVSLAFGSLEDPQGVPETRNVIMSYAEMGDAQVGAVWGAFIVRFPAFNTVAAPTTVGDLITAIYNPVDTNEHQMSAARTIELGFIAVITARGNMSTARVTKFLGACQSCGYPQITLASADVTTAWNRLRTLSAAGRQDAYNFTQAAALIRGAPEPLRIFAIQGLGRGAAIFTTICSAILHNPQGVTWQIPLSTYPVESNNVLNALNRFATDGWFCLYTANESMKQQRFLHLGKICWILYQNQQANLANLRGAFRNVSLSAPILAWIADNKDSFNEARIGDGFYASSQELADLLASWAEIQG